jgi:hypothetical protein
MRFGKMVRFLSILAAKLRPAACLCVAAASILLAAPGCARMNLRGEPFPEEPMSDMVQRLRQVDDQAQSFAFSNKARQIDRDLGVR